MHQTFRLLHEGYSSKKAARLRQSLPSGNNLSRRRCLGRFLSERPPDNKFLNVKMSHVAPWQNSGEVEEGMEHRGMEESGILNCTSTSIA